MKKTIKNIVVGVSGGIAAYKIPLLVRSLKKNGYEVKVVLTTASTGLVGADALRTVSGNPIYQDVAAEFDMGHIRLEEWADCLLIAPATGNTIAKIAHGIADNLLTTLALAVHCPIVIAPAMNTNMWKNDVTQENISKISSRGITVLPVGNGELACGVIGAGRMIEPDDIAAYIAIIGVKKVLCGKKVLITSGPTSEPIDPVRVLSNSSTGQMGAALARAAYLMGASVTIVSGPAITPIPGGIDSIAVQSADQMFSAVKELQNSHDYFVMAAAVSDFKSDYSEDKIERQEDGTMILRLTPNPDIAAFVGTTLNEVQKLVTFSLEKSGGFTRARAKMNKKKAHLTVIT